LGIGVAEGAKQYGADDGEERGIGADAEGDGEYDGRSEAGAFGDHAGGEAKVLPECTHRNSPLYRCY
jgi:hypothetical protein